MGDAAGIGPEVVVKALADGSLRDICDCKVIGDRVHLERIAVSLGIDTSVLTDVCDLKNLPGEPPVGVDDAVTGRAAAESIIKAVDLWRSGEIDAIATAPISKKSIRLGGYDFQGHTEFLASLTDTERFAMSFFGGEIQDVRDNVFVARERRRGMRQRHRQPAQRDQLRQVGHAVERPAADCLGSFEEDLVERPHERLREFRIGRIDAQTTGQPPICIAAEGLRHAELIRKTLRLRQRTTADRHNAGSS